MGRLVAVVMCLALSCIGFQNASGAEYTETHHHHLFHSWHAVFNYDPSLHNVVSVDLDSYDTCTLGESPKIYESGNDRVVLEKGNSFFFSSKGRGCDNKMKIEVQAWDFPPQP
ncbi:hypothetical protein NL676_036537 [Syzygium grande]|nr:hypothetical protein NL676_036537 [Syzygium grande]